MRKDNETDHNKHRDCGLCEERYSFFINKECEYFPCHETDDPEHFNCLFCYCPLYPLGENCGGNFSHTAAGIKDCSQCLIPHGKNGFEFVQQRINGLIGLMKQLNAPNSEKERRTMHEE